MLNFKLQRQTVATLVGLSFLCILPMVAAFSLPTVRTEAAHLSPLRPSSF
jgi:hypothetical protein